MNSRPDATETAAFDAAVSGDDMVIAKFQTKSCVICRRIEPGLKAVAERLADQVSVVDVDAEENAALAERYSVRGVPTLILFKGGNELGRCNGFQSVGMLREWLAPHLDD
jgi:thioredoxin-like negative regulator of GroEL